jgi:hypothetical protein
VQRSYYCPQTVYKPVTTYEPVTSYRTSYYYEPVTTMRTSCYVDPCTGCTTQVACPQTCYQLRSKCDACTSYVARISYQPVTAYRQSFYYEPVTIQPSCCPTTVAAAPAAPCCPTTGAPVVTAPPAAPAPTTTESTIPPVQQTAPPPLNIPQDNRSMPSTTEKSVPSNLTSPKPATVPIRADRLASRSNASNVVGSVVTATWQPQGNATVRFVSQNDATLPVSTDATGRFNVVLPTGKWRIYTQDAAGRPTYHSEITVNGESRNLMVVNR